MRIAGKNTDKDWKILKEKLEDKPSKRLWASAFRCFYRKRIDTRYLNPITSIKLHDKKEGEGFAITALFCTLIEFLESCEKGHNFHFVGRTTYILKPFEYSERQASQYFKDFLRTRIPFKNLIPPALVDQFYQDVRCGLLHEAQTKGIWYISSRHSNNVLIYPKKDRITIYRNQLIQALETYFNDYRSRLLIDKNTQQAFIRKFDNLCQI